VNDQLDLFEQPEKPKPKVTLAELQEMVRQGATAEEIYKARWYDIWGRPV
jgi:hypothetical protein